MREFLRVVLMNVADRARRAARRRPPAAPAVAFDAVLGSQPRAALADTRCLALYLPPRRPGRTAVLPGRQPPCRSGGMGADRRGPRSRRRQGRRRERSAPARQCAHDPRPEWTTAQRGASCSPTGRGDFCDRRSSPRRPNPATTLPSTWSAPAPPRHRPSCASLTHVRNRRARRPSCNLALDRPAAVSPASDRGRSNAAACSSRRPLDAGDRAQPSTPPSTAAFSAGAGAGDHPARSLDRPGARPRRRQHVLSSGRPATRRSGLTRRTRTPASRQASRRASSPMLERHAPGIGKPRRRHAELPDARSTSSGATASPAATGTTASCRGGPDAHARARRSASPRATRRPSPASISAAPAAHPGGGDLRRARRSTPARRILALERQAMRRDYARILGGESDAPRPRRARALPRRCALAHAVPAAHRRS
jgi:hypothetical protein